MTLSSMRSLLVAAAASACLAGSANAAPKVRCMTEEGGGRLKPCDAAFERSNPDWRSSDVCMVEDRDGKYRPCSVEYKRRHAK